MSGNNLEDSMKSDMQVPPLEEINYDTLNSREFNGFFKKLRNSLEKFTRDWNADESKRDKTFTVFN